MCPPTSERSFGSSFLPTLENISQSFRMSLVPLALFYSSITKLFLLFLLSVWRPSNEAVPAPAIQAPMFNESAWNHNLTTAFHFFDDNKIDREWIVRNILGGMSAGFGLRGTYLFSVGLSSVLLISHSDIGLASILYHPHHFGRMDNEDVNCGRSEWVGGREQCHR